VWVDWTGLTAAWVRSCATPVEDVKSTAFRATLGHRKQVKAKH